MAPAGRLFFPLDETTTVGGCAITPEAGRIAIEEAAERPYQRATDHLQQDHRIRISKQTLERITMEVGSYWLERDEASFEALEAQSCRAGALPGKVQDPPDRCLIFADGVMVHMDEAWHEAKVGTVRTEWHEGDELKQTAKGSLVRCRDVQTFEKDLWRKAVQAGYHQALVAAFLADGSHWLWNLARRCFDKAIQILDFYHLSEHVHRCAAVFFGEGTDPARQWAKQVTGTLRAGQLDAALMEIEALPGRGKLKRRAKHELVTYLNNNRERMDYPRYEAMGLPIGSGEVEAQCKTLVQARCKQSGMRWTREGVEALLRVRCAVREGAYRQQFAQWPINFTAWRDQQRRRENAA